MSNRSRYQERLAKVLDENIPAITISQDGEVLANTNASLNVFPLNDPLLLVHLSLNQLPYIKDGKVYQPTVIPHDDQTFTLTFSEITKAYYDSLTGAHNRLAIDEKIASLENDHEDITLLFADMDDFKTINDTLGHAVGDELLISTVKILNSLFRKGIDMVGRYGGDEFIVILPGISENDATEKLKSLDKIIETTNAKRNEMALPLIKVSIKSATRTTDSQETLIETIKKADLAMYQNKEKRKKIISHDPDILDRLKDVTSY